MDILEGPALLLCSLATGAYLLWRNNFQQGRIQLTDQQSWNQTRSIASIRITYALFAAISIGLLISISNLVALLVLIIQQQNGNLLHFTGQDLLWTLMSSICFCFAWVIQTRLAFLERHRHSFSNPLRLFWVSAFILSTFSFSLWINNKPGSDLSWRDSINGVTTIAKFAQSILVTILGILQGCYQRRISKSTEGGSIRIIPSSHSGHTTLCENINCQGATDHNKSKQKKDKSGSPKVDASQKDYKRPTTFKEFYSHCKRLRPFIWPSDSRKLQVHIMLCLGLLVVGRIVNVLVPWQVANVVDALTKVSDGSPEGRDEDGNPRFVWKEIIFFIGLRALQGNIGAVDTLQGLLWIPVGQFNTRELAVKMFEHLLNLSLRFHLNRKTGEMLRVQDRGVSSVVTLLSSLLFNILPCLVDIAVACIVLTRSFDIYFGIIVAVTMICYIYTTILMTDWRTRYRRESNALDNAVEARAVDSLLNYETIKLFATEEYEVGKYTEAILAYQKADRKSQSTLGILNTTLNLVIQGGLALGCLLCAKRVAQNEMNVREFVMYYTYILQLYTPLNQFGSSYRSLQKNFIDMEKMLDLFEEPIEVKDSPEAKQLVMAGGDVVFENVSFGYNPQNPNLKSVSFRIPHGKKLALVGPSGGGKSTILRLLFRFYDPIQGRILIDGQDIKTVTQTSLRRKIGIVPQDTALFNESIGYNIGYGKIGQDTAQAFDPTSPSASRRLISSGGGPGLGLGPRRLSSSGRSLKQNVRGKKNKHSCVANSTEHGGIEGDVDADVDGEEGNEDDDKDWEDDLRIQAAADAARIHEIVSRFPEGYSTKVGERGLRLSGGEKQRVAIARTILKNPPILLLDEATSALDTQTEREIQNSLESISKDRTTLIIAHRLSTIVDADEILVIQKGEIAEQGSHEELMRSGGIYAAMWMQQLREDRTSSNSSHSSQKESSKGEDSEEDFSDEQNGAVGRLPIRRNHYGGGRYPDRNGYDSYGDERILSFSLPTYPSGYGRSRSDLESGPSSRVDSGSGTEPSTEFRYFTRSRFGEPSISQRLLTVQESDVDTNMTQELHDEHLAEGDEELEAHSSSSRSPTLVN